MARRRKVDYRKVINYLLLVVGSLLAVWLGRALIAAVPTSQWPVSTAIIYKSEVIYTTSNPSDKEKTLHSARINYRYQVDGVTYFGDQIYQTDIPLLGREAATDLVLEFPTGSIQKVRYNPQDPGAAVLKTGVSGTLLLLVAPTLLFLVIGFSAVRTKRGK
jgi:hypothetical protein